jgi:hypothetical protein
MYNIFVQSIFCISKINSYYRNATYIILTFEKMLKRKYIIYIWVIIIFLLFIIYSFLWSIRSDKNLIFSYPNSKISFAWTEIPMSWRDYINKQRFDKEFLISWSNLYQFYLYIKRYSLYVPYIEKKLKETWIPDDFKYLPIAESALREDIVSPAWAAWIWQFMPETAKRFWLIINNNIDERYNFKKSTDAALRYIDFLYWEFWDRTLTAAAYNRWEWWIKRALESQWVSSYYDLYLNEETSRYIFRIVSIKYLINDYFNKKWLIDPIIWWIYKKPNTEIIKVTSIANLILWSNEKWQNYKTIKILNPWILWDSVPLWKWEIKVLK